MLLTNPKNDTKTWLISAYLLTALRQFDASVKHREANEVMEQRNELVAAIEPNLDHLLYQLLAL